MHATIGWFPLLLCVLAAPLSARTISVISPEPTWPRTPPLSRRTPVPSYARQTGLACSACHYQFLTLTPFGRKFKLNGYTLTNLPTLEEKDSTNGGRLSLSPVLAALRRW